MTRKATMSPPTTGILGMGYLGSHLLTLFPDLFSWGTFHQTLPPKPEPTNITWIEFQWENWQTWKHLPQEPATLVLTIPPVCQDIDSEVKRLVRWGQWMKKERSQLTKMIYISSTGVYPSQDRTWTENDVFKPDRLSGKLRLETERVLGDFFQLFILRAGGIYGPQRHLGQRILHQKSISTSQRPIHRIHVSDLAGIVQQYLVDERGPACVNTVDQDPKPAAEVIEWLLRNNWLNLPPGLSILYQKRETIAEGDPGNHRLISNHRLLHEMHYSLQFPSFREGYARILGKSEQA